jgi:hypothetical protein
MGQPSDVTGNSILRDKNGVVMNNVFLGVLSTKKSCRDLMGINVLSSCPSSRLIQKEVIHWYEQREYRFFIRIEKTKHCS